MNCLRKKDYDFKFVNVTRKPKIPVIISRQEVRDILDKVMVYDYKICLELIYACGLRIGEVTGIKISEIDGKRNILTVRSGKGNRDRTVPIPENILVKLREYWKTHRNPDLLFPKINRGSKNFDRAKTTETISLRTVQSAMRMALKESGINKRVTPHTLRHCYATHLLEAGANIKAISKFLGHRSLRPTLIYLQLTNHSESQSYDVLNEIMRDL